MLKVLKIRPQLPEKLKGTIVERWINYWKGLGRDYKDVCLESLKYMKDYPVRSSVYGSIALFAYTCYKTNPNYNLFTDRMRYSQNLVSLVYPESQNPNAIKHLSYLEKCRNEDTIRITSLALFSIIWVHDFSSKLSTADAQCKYLQPELSTFKERIIDVGFMGKWWNIEKQMKDYDVNY